MVKPFGIVMPNWNKERYVGAAIDSVLHQIDPDWLLVIADDESTDGSLAQIRRRDDRRIRVIEVPHQGPGMASRRAMEVLQAEGVELVGVLDSDDALHPEAVSTVRRAYAAHPECGLVYTQNWRCNEDLQPIERGRARPIPRGESVLSLHDTGKVLCVNHWLTFRMEAYLKTEGFMPIARHQDMDLIFRLEEVAQLHFVDERLYYYRILEEGLHTGKRIQDFSAVVKDLARRRRAQHS